MLVPWGAEGRSVHRSHSQPRFCSASEHRAPRDAASRAGPSHSLRPGAWRRPGPEEPGHSAARRKPPTGRGLCASHRRGSSFFPLEVCCAHHSRTGGPSTPQGGSTRGRGSGFRRARRLPCTFPRGLRAEETEGSITPGSQATGHTKTGQSVHLQTQAG